ncbi:Pao retrotransposon peptidase [Popillia japonica]|uniref:Pao retrotransposon peptidase n=1 Tax=Popillia japonica TaxID=7064 RepID=A0AAW1JHZ1_POPJA
MLDLEEPKTPTAVRSFLGMVNYIGKFLPRSGNDLASDPDNDLACRPQFCYNLIESNLFFARECTAIVKSLIPHVHFAKVCLLSTCTLSAKVLLQRLWMEKLTWDEPVSTSIQTKCTSYRYNLSKLNDLQIPRYALCKPTNVEIHDFSDASLQGYGACIYLRSVDQQNNIGVNSLCTKTKVAPLKPITIPKLDLCPALLLTAKAYHDP